MKVLYLFLDGTKSPGVISKVKSKIRFLNELGMEVTGIFMNRNITSRSYNAEERIIYLPLSVKPLPHIYNRRFLRDYKWYFGSKSYLKQFYEQLSNEVSKHKFDLILFRYPLSNKYLLRFAEKYRGRIVFEHNSKELVEMEMDAGKPSMRYYIPAEEKFGPLVLAKAKALTGVGNEITAYEVQRSGRNDIRHAVVPNGIDVKSLPVRNAPVLTDVLKVLFVTGSPSPWVGIDILLNSLAGYSGSRKLKVYLVGPLSEEVSALVSQNNLSETVVLTGEKRGKELDAYFDECHIAIGTLAMQRVQLNEHSSLKVLEYASRGIPFVISYEETNFAPVKDFAPYYLQTTYNGKSIDLNTVVSFAEKVAQNPSHPQEMRSLAEQYLDFSVKMKGLKDFLETLNNE